MIDEARRVAIPGITARNRDISDSRGRALFAALSGVFSWLDAATAHRHLPYTVL